MSKPSPFDVMAASYDADFTGSEIGKMQRSRVWTFLKPVLQESGRPLEILEINAGTGHDALQLAVMGHRVQATDASFEMVKRAKERLGDLPKGTGNLCFSVCTFDDLPLQFPGKQFDLIFSDFGGLNCIDESAMKRLVADLYSLTRPGGKLFLVLMGSCCIHEVAYYALRGKLSKAFRRQGKPVEFKAGERSLQIKYYSPGKLKRLFRPLFHKVQSFPVGLFIPPSYLEKKYSDKPKNLNRLNRLEKKFGYSFLCALSDHYGIILKRAETLS